MEWSARKWYKYTTPHQSSLENLSLSLPSSLPKKGIHSLSRTVHLHIHVPVVSGTDGAFVLKLIIQTQLVEGVRTEEVYGWQRQASHTQTTLHHLEHLGTA